MASAPVVTWKFDQDKLNAAIAERIKVQGRSVRTFAQIVNTALYSVALKAQKYTPSVDIAKIDVEMHIQVNYVINKKGESVPGGKGKKFNYFESASPNATNALGDHASIALLFAIVLARANLSRQGRQTGTSRYNELTNNAWKLDKSILTSRAVIWDIAERMVSARHSSKSMLRAGWKPALDILRQFIASNDLGGGSGGERFAFDEDSQRLGTAIPAKEGWVCFGTIENNVGEPGTGDLSQKQRTALLKYGSEPFARALSDEADAMNARIMGWLEKESAAFNREMQ